MIRRISWFVLEVQRFLILLTLRVQEPTRTLLRRFVAAVRDCAWAVWSKHNGFAISQSGKPFAAGIVSDLETVVWRSSSTFRDVFDPMTSLHASLMILSSFSWRSEEPTIIPIPTLKKISWLSFGFCGLVVLHTFDKRGLNLHKT